MGNILAGLGGLGNPFQQQQALMQQQRWQLGTVSIGTDTYTSDSITINADTSYLNPVETPMPDTPRKPMVGPMCAWLDKQVNEICEYWH